MRTNVIARTAVTALGSRGMRQDAVVTRRPSAAEIIGAIGPNPEHREALMLFGQFVGSWDWRRDAVHTGRSIAAGSRRVAFLLGPRGPRDPRRDPHSAPWRARSEPVADGRLP